MIRVRLGKMKVLVSQLIDKFFINLVLINIFIFSAIVLIFHAIPEFYKADISGNIAYKSTMVKYSFVTDIYIEVHIII